MTLFDVAIYRVILTTGTQKETGLLIPFVAAILGTKFLANLCLVCQNSTQLRTARHPSKESKAAETHKKGKILTIKKE